MYREPDSWTSDPPKLIANHGQDLYVMFLDTKLSSHSVSLHKGVKMAKAKREKKAGGRSLR